MTVREQLRLAYYRADLTHAEIAARAGVHENTVGRILAGQNANIDSVIAVASVLGLTALSVSTISSLSPQSEALAR